MNSGNLDIPMPFFAASRRNVPLLEFNEGWNSKIYSLPLEFLNDQLDGDAPHICDNFCIDLSYTFH